MLKPDFVVQTLGVIVQAYASILAIVGAFYIFLIERTRSELRGARDRLENAVEIFYRNVMSNRAEFYDTLMDRGIDFLDELAERWPNFKKRTEYRDLVECYQIYRSLEKRVGLWAFRYFSPIFGYYAIMLLLLFGELYVISIWGIMFVIDIFYKILIIFSSFGIVLFMKLISDLAVMK